MKNLLTPKTGTTRHFAGRLLTGGRHFALVSDIDSYAKRQVLLGDVEMLQDKEGVAVALPDSAQENELRVIAEDYMVTQPWNAAEGQTYEEYMADVFRFAAAAYASELNGETEESEEELRQQAAEKAAAEKEAAEKAAAEKEAAEKAAAEKEAAEKEAAEKEAAEKAAAAAEKKAAAAEKKAADKAAQ